MSTMGIWQRFREQMSSLLGEAAKLESTRGAAKQPVQEHSLEDFADAVCDVGYILKKHNVSYEAADSPGFSEAIAELREFAKRGDDGAQYYLACLLALDGPFTDKEEAYIWFYTSYSRRGYSVEFGNENGDSSTYLGKIGDFRNEPKVCELVECLGVERIRELDLIAVEWSARYSYSE